LATKRSDIVKFFVNAVSGDASMPLSEKSRLLGLVCMEKSLPLVTIVLADENEMMPSRRPRQPMQPM
jgi:hypothetical protein